MHILELSYANDIKSCRTRGVMGGNKRVERGTLEARRGVTNEERKKGGCEGKETGQCWEAGMRVCGHFI